MKCYNKCFDHIHQVFMGHFRICTKECLHGKNIIKHLSNLNFLVEISCQKGFFISNFSPCIQILNIKKKKKLPIFFY